MNTIVVVSIGLLGLLLFGLGANVTRHRAIRGRNGGPQSSLDPTDRLFIAARAHGNASEYIPTLGVLLVVCNTLTDGWWIEALAVSAVVFRSVHAFGMLRSETLAAHGPVRDIGAIGTYVTGLALGITAIASI